MDNDSNYFNNIETAVNLDGVFMNCSNITNVPAGTFSNENITSMTDALTGTGVEDLSNVPDKFRDVAKK